MTQPAAKLTGVAALCLSLASCASMGEQPKAPPPARPLVMSSFFTGRWYEVARTPTSFTDNCMAGTTDFIHRPSDGHLVELDECRVGSPAGKIRSFRGPITILNPGQNNEFSVHYTIYGFIPITVTYWVLDEAADGSWFIVANPSFTQADILGRAPRQTPAEVAALTARLQALGYDTSKLEYPPTFPPGSG